MSNRITAIATAVAATLAVAAPAASAAERPTLCAPTPGAGEVLFVAAAGPLVRGGIAFDRSTLPLGSVVIRDKIVLRKSRRQVSTVAIVGGDAVGGQTCVVMDLPAATRYVDHDTASCPNPDGEPAKASYEFNIGMPPWAMAALRRSGHLHINWWIAGGCQND